MQREINKDNVIYNKEQNYTIYNLPIEKEIGLISNLNIRKNILNYNTEKRVALCIHFLSGTIKVEAIPPELT